MNWKISFEILAPHDQSSQCVRETSKNDSIYLINLGVSEVCDSQFVAPGTEISVL